MIYLSENESAYSILNKNMIKIAYTDCGNSVGCTFRIFLNQFLYLEMSEKSILNIRDKKKVFVPQLIKGDYLMLNDSKVLNYYLLRLETDNNYNKGVLSGFLYRRYKQISNCSFSLSYFDKNVVKFIKEYIEQVDGIESIQIAQEMIKVSFKSNYYLKSFNSSIDYTNVGFPIAKFKESEPFFFGFIRGLMEDNSIQNRLILNSVSLKDIIELSKLLLYYGVTSSIFKIKYKSLYMYRIGIQLRQLEKLVSILGVFYYNLVLPYSNNKYQTISKVNNYVRIAKIEHDNVIKDFYELNNKLFRFILNS